MAKKRKSGGKHKRSCGRQGADTPQKPSKNWVHNLRFEAVDNDKEETGATSAISSFRIVSWNILAEAYLSRRSQKNLPYQSQKVVFYSKRRRQVLKSILSKWKKLSVDVICLQEMDIPMVSSRLKDLGYEGVSTPTTPGGAGAGGRVDACCTYWDDESWECLDHELIRLDDLATLKADSAAQLDCPLYGFQQSFSRRNVAILTRLRHKQSKDHVVVANAHLFWNPKYEYVKLCQAHYILNRVKAFVKEGEPVVFCGDLNSQPSSSVHTYLSKGRVNAKILAPWYKRTFEEESEDVVEMNELVEMTASVDEVSEKLESTKLEDKADDDEPRIRYLMDYTLNRFTRWLRILGVDAALETEEEEIQRTKHGNILLFERCKEEGRALVTTSSKLTLRKDCPGGAYHIAPSMSKNLELCLVRMLLMHGVVLEPANFLTRCVVCNGSIGTVEDIEEKRRVFIANQAPDLSADLECYCCDDCGQGYWWCDRPTSSASRVKNQATRLFELCLRGGVPIKGDLNMFDFVDVEAERMKELDPDKSINMEQPEVVTWLKNKELTCPLQLESAYALRDENGRIVGERQAFSNVTNDFVGLLDYVLFEPTKLQVSGRLYIPSSFNKLNQRLKIQNGHLLPSDIWPSDHLAVGAELCFLKDDPDADDGEKAEEQAEDSAAFCAPLENGGVLPPMFTMRTAHKPKCACGCVPAIPSMFEMAELRKKARLKKQREARLQNFS